MTTILNDSFNRANTTISTTGLGRADTGQTWQSFNSGRGRITNNTAEVNLDPDDAGLVINSGLSNFILQVKFLTPNGYLQIILKADTSRGDYLFIEGNSSGVWGITSYGSGNWQSLARYNGTVGERASGTIKAVVNNNLIDVFLNDKNIMSATTTFLQGNTYQGLATGQGSQVYDDYSVSEFTVPETHNSSLNVKGTGKINVNATVEKKQIIHNTTLSINSINVLNAIPKREQSINFNVTGKGLIVANTNRIKSAVLDITISSNLILTVQKLIQVIIETYGKGLLSVNGQITKSTNFNVLGKSTIFVNSGNTKVATTTLQLNTESKLNLQFIKIINSNADFKSNGNVFIFAGDSKSIFVTMSFISKSGLAVNTKRTANVRLNTITKGLFTTNSQKLLLSDLSPKSTSLFDLQPSVIRLAQVLFEASGIFNIHDGEPIIGIINLNAKRELYVYLVAQQSLEIYVKAKRNLFVQLRGDVNVTMENQNFTMYSGDTKYIRFPIEGISDLSGLSVSWFIRNTPLTKRTNDGITIVNNEVQIKLDPEDTTKLSGPYYHECSVTDNFGNHSKVLTGYISIK
ncbi:hypothetical protein [Lederbergia citri]|uniref:Uncharacterized protein n=1 Tax=Lederbergia citri TaxID=2833580 RepID=A0A942TEF7_9BACI|nr:hypothetical protein [Lederbergia citri]MBS4195313.1 hypothetical protein [Lederbergia citri]